MSCKKYHPKIHTRWAPTSYKWSYNPYKWPYNWVTGVITLLIEVITPFITSRGPTLYPVVKNGLHALLNEANSLVQRPSLKGTTTAPWQAPAPAFGALRSQRPMLKMAENSINGPCVRVCVCGVLFW